MKTYFEDIFKYQSEVNQYIIEELIRHKTKLPSDVHLLISHSLNAQQVWNARILKNFEIGVFDLLPLEEIAQLDIENYNTTLHIINNVDLKTVIYYSSTSGIKYQNSITEILNQVTQHFSYHRGQIISKLIQKGITLKPTDYIYWCREEINS